MLAIHLLQLVAGHDTARDEERDQRHTALEARHRQQNAGQAERARDEVDDHDRFAHREAEQDEAVRHMVVPASADGHAASQPRDRHQCGVEDGDAQDDHRHEEVDGMQVLEEVHLDLEPQDREHEAEEERAGVAHEDARRVEVVVQKAEAGAAQRRRHAGDQILLGGLEHGQHEEVRARDGRRPDGETVHIVEQVEGVRDADDPQ